MNELVERLSRNDHPVEVNRPDKTPASLKSRIDLGYIHVLFSDTGTEIGIQLDKKKCDLTKANFEKASGKVHLEGCITLNYDKVRCIADINLKDLKGTGHLQPVDEAEYASIVNVK
jgi:hypothetical protein